MNQSTEDKQQNIIVYAYNATGKTEAAKKYKNIVDLDSAPFLFIYDPSVAHLSFEERKGLVHLRKENPEYPQNMIQEIRKEFQKNKIVLVPFNEENINSLCPMEGVRHIFVFPEEKSFEIYAKRMKLRGNNDIFIERRRNEFLKFHNIFKNKKGVEKIIIPSNAFLDHVLMEHGLSLK